MTLHRRPRIRSVVVATGWALYALAVAIGASSESLGPEPIRAYAFAVASSLLLVAWARWSREADGPVPASRRRTLRSAAVVVAAALCALIVISPPSSVVAVPPATVAVLGTVRRLVTWRIVVVLGALALAFRGAYYFGAVLIAVGTIAWPRRPLAYLRELVPPRVGSERGFTISEAMAALALITVGIGASWAVLTDAGRHRRHAEAAALRLVAADRAIEELRSEGGPAAGIRRTSVPPEAAAGHRDWVVVTRVRQRADGTLEIVARVEGGGASTELVTILRKGTP